VAGTIKSSSNLSIGSPNFPALTRVYVAVATDVNLSGSVALGANLYDANALMRWSSAIEVYGAVFAGNFDASSTVKIHYDREVVSAGQGCPPDGGTGCGSCKDCNNQACINGACGSCTDSSQCCAPLKCFQGTCIMPIS